MRRWPIARRLAGVQAHPFVLSRQDIDQRLAALLTLPPNRGVEELDHILDALAPTDATTGSGYALDDLTLSATSAVAAPQRQRSPTRNTPGLQAPTVSSS